jgi:hypothetical protein
MCTMSIMSPNRFHAPSTLLTNGLCCRDIRRA